ncbi:MAG: hypothetical protein EXQ92_11445, partial [Alphaproteobacteria bacterium]|nr:hypothetical protein [Alphaproteobacteria bacterium]
MLTWGVPEFGLVMRSMTRSLSRFNPGSARCDDKRNLACLDRLWRSRADLRTRLAGARRRGDFSLRYPVRRPRYRSARLAEARTAGVVPGRDAAVAAARARIVISAVTAAEAADVAAEAAGYLRHGQIFFDINSASPATKTRSAQLVEAAGARFVEGAGAAPLAGLL